MRDSFKRHGHLLAVGIPVNLDHAIVRRLELACASPAAKPGEGARRMELRLGTSAWGVK